jgi:hypothetical protein
MWLVSAMNPADLTPATASAKLIEKFTLSPNCDTPQKTSNPSIFGDPQPVREEPSLDEEAPSSDKWEVGHDYDLEERLGTGSYGDVAKAKHIPTGTTVAIKRVYNVFQHERDAR